MNAVILAMFIHEKREVLKLSGDLQDSVVRLARFRVFSVGEMAEIAGISEHLVRKAANPEDLPRSRTGVYARHLEYLLRMVSSREFCKIHTATLLKDGATFSALSRVTGQPERSLRRWAGEETP